MAYKKYIKKNGKLYGPYVYESKRVDGKVVSEYKGSAKSVKLPKIKPHHYRKIFFILLLLFFIGVLVQFLFIFPNVNKLSGKIIFEVDSSYKSGNPIDGIIKLSLFEGEFLPAYSKIVFKNSGNSYEFNLNEIISDPTLQGEYYLFGGNIEGQGEGYGIEGKNIIYPELDFTLELYQVDNSVDDTEEVILEEDEFLDDDLNEIVGEPSGITGNSIKKSRNTFGSLFGITGMVSMELKNEIAGKVSKDKPFTYELREGERVELKYKSVYLGEEALSDDEVSLNIRDGVLEVSTDYVVVKKGYGSEYIGDKKKTLIIDLSELNLVLEEGDLDIELTYEDEKIVSIHTSIVNNGKISEKIEKTPEEQENQEEIQDSEEDDLNEIIEDEETDEEEVIDSSIWGISDFLSESEREILLNEFGKIQLKNANAEMFKGRLVVGYEIGEYYIEYTYDTSLNDDILEVQMERDRIRFLKDVANSISTKNALSLPVNEFQENYDF